MAYVSERARRPRERPAEVRRHRFPRDVLRLPQRQARRRARPGARSPRSKLAAGIRARPEPREARRRVVLALGARGAGCGERAPSHPGRARGGGHVPHLQDDARPVDGAGCRPDAQAHLRSGSRRATRRARSSASWWRSSGASILAEPSKHGFNLLAWVLPFVGLGLGAAVLGALAWRWSRSRRQSTGARRGRRSTRSSSAGSTKSLRDSTPSGANG